MKQIFLITFLLSVKVLFAQVTFTATVDRNKIAVNERIQLTFTLSNGEGKNFVAPPFNDFYIVGGPSQSTQISSYNGKSTQSITIGYVLQPKSTGKFSIAPASIKSNGKQYSTESISIEVTEKSTQSNQSKNATTDLNAYAKENCFLKTEVSQTNIFKGENTIVTHKLYVAKNAFGDYQATGGQLNPKFNGFYAEDIPLNNNQGGSLETLNGKTYQVYTIKKTKLTAQQAGNLVADPLSFDMVVAIKTKKQSKSRDPFEDFFNSSPFSSSYEKIQITVTSPTQKINVFELPPNPPKDFNGAVGNFSMKSEINELETKTDDPLTYKITISGSGNLSLFEAPKIELPPGWETYDPTISESGNAKTYTYLLIPRSPGEFIIPAHTWSFFSPDNKKFETLSSESYTVKVEANTNYTPSNNASANKEEIEMLAQDIRFITKEKPVFHLNTNTLSNNVFYAFAGAPIILSIFLFISSMRRNRMRKDVIGLKNKKATSVARKRLTKAHAYAKQQESRLFYDETMRTLWGYLSDKFNILPGDLSKENIQTYLTQNQISENTKNAFLTLLNRCEIALYAPQLAQEKLEDVYQNAIELISTIEEELSK